MFGEDLTAFFKLSDFAVNAFLIRQQKDIQGLLHAPTLEMALEPSPINGRAFTLVTPITDGLDLEINDTLIINNDAYTLLQCSEDGTGLSYLMLEQQIPCTLNSMQDF